MVYTVMILQSVSLKRKIQLKKTAVGMQRCIHFERFLNIYLHRETEDVFSSDVRCFLNLVIPRHKKTYWWFSCFLLGAKSRIRRFYLFAILLDKHKGREERIKREVGQGACNLHWLNSFKKQRKGGSKTRHHWFSSSEVLTKNGNIILAGQGLPTDNERCKPIKNKTWFVWKSVHFFQKCKHESKIQPHRNIVM